MKSTHEMLASEEFRSLVRRKWTVSVILTACLFVLYYGYILLIAVNKELLARRIGAFTTLGIPLGVAVIVLSWVLTALYVLWANSRYDAAVKHLSEQVED
jgi:uncharacterized membrane protein (DUF485 family)